MIPKPKYYGSATVGERGQIVIPAEARKKLNIKAGDKLVVLGMHFGKEGRGRLMLVKSEVVAQFLSESIAVMGKLRKVLEKVKK